MNNFCKNPMKSIANESIRAKIKQSIYQADIDDNMTNMKMANYNQFNSINIGAIYIT